MNQNRGNQNPQGGGQSQNPMKPSRSDVSQNPQREEEEEEESGNRREEDEESTPANDQGNTAGQQDRGRQDRGGNSPDDQRRS